MGLKIEYDKKVTRKERRDIQDFNKGTADDWNEVKTVVNASEDRITAIEAAPPGSGDMVLALTQTVTGKKTFNHAKFALRNIANTFNGLFSNTNTADRTYTLQDADGTIAFLSDISAGSGDMILADAQTVTGAKTFNDTTLLLRNVANTNSSRFTNTNASARVYTLQDASGTIAFTSDITPGVTDHTLLTNIGTNTHVQLDSHLATSTIHFTEASIDHTAISNIGTNSHTVIDTHIANITTNPHAVEWVDLSDKDRVPQAPTTVAAATGAVQLDMVKSVQDITLTGNVTAITFTNEPAVGDRVSALLNVYQNATGGYTMAWTGSGVFGADGEVAADFEPLATALAHTQYWLNWNGNEWIIRIVKVSITAL